MIKYIVILITCILSISCTAQNTEFTTKIDIATIHSDVIDKEVQLIDIRTPKEYNAGYIDDAINIDISNLTNFNAEADKLDKTKPIYIYCHSGIRSRKASKVLKELGFIKIYDFSGGWRAWRNQHK